MSEAVDQARAHLAEGRRWRARDVLTARVAEHHDPTALDLLGEVLHDMGDLPAAGAAWFGTRRLGDDVDASVAAWRERYDDDFVAMWRSLPRSVRIQPGPRRLEALRERARAASSAGARRSEEVLSRPPFDGSAQRADGTVGEPDADSEGDGDSEAGGGLDAATIIAWVLAAAFVVCAVVGLVTVLRWIVP